MNGVYCGQLWQINGQLYVVRTGGPTAGDVCPVVAGPHAPGASGVQVKAPIGRIQVYQGVFAIDELTALVRDL